MALFFARLRSRVCFIYSAPPLLFNYFCSFSLAEPFLLLLSCFFPLLFSRLSLFFPFRPYVPNLSVLLLLCRSIVFDAFGSIFLLCSICVDRFLFHSLFFPFYYFPSPCSLFFLFLSLSHLFLFTAIFSFTWPSSLAECCAHYSVNRSRVSLTHPCIVRVRPVHDSGNAGSKLHAYRGCRAISFRDSSLGTQSSLLKNRARAIVLTAAKFLSTDPTQLR